MKKFLTLGALALTLAVLSTQQASAWTNFKFGVGLNFGYQAGGNNFGWGLFRNGQPPEACCPGGAPQTYAPGMPAPQTYAHPSMDQGFNGGVQAPATTNVPAQPSSYRAYPTQTVNYQYSYPYPYSYPYYYGYTANAYYYGR